MAGGAWHRGRVERLRATIERHVAAGAVPGAAWLLARRGDVVAGTAGTVAEGGPPVARDTIFRISSLTKPMVAVAALALVEECRLRLDDPVDPWLPELAGRQVLVDPAGPPDGATAPAARPVSLRDLLTFRLGLGMDFGHFGEQPVMDALAALGLGAGPPRPAGPPEPDEWMRRFGTLPLAYQPGERWLYDTSADVLGVLVARAAGRPLGALLAERIFEPLGMADTGFSVPAATLDRFGPHYTTDPATGTRVEYDPAAGEWSRPPAFPSGAGGLVSTVDDLLAFGTMLRAGGVYQGRRILSRPSVEAMTTNQLTDAQLAASAPDPGGALGWGFGVGVQLRRDGAWPSVGSYAWAGGLGSQWANDPVEGLVGVVLTNLAWTSGPPALFPDFWTCAYAAMDD